MSTFELDSGGQPDSPKSPRTVMPNPLLDEEEADSKGNISPVSRRNKSALSNDASLLSQPGRNLDMAERKWLQDKWFALDTSGDGVLEFAETKVMLRDIKKKMTDAEISDAFKEMDVDGCGSVDFDEFYVWFARQDADQFAHLMSRTAHRQFVRGMIMLGVTMFFPCGLIILISGPSIVVRFLRLRAPFLPESRQLTCVQMDSAACVRATGRPRGFLVLPGARGWCPRLAGRGVVHGRVCSSD